MAHQRREAFARARRSVRLTQEQFATRVGVDVSSVKRWERGASTPQWTMWPTIADVLGIAHEHLAAMLDDAPLAPVAPDANLTGAALPDVATVAVVPVPRQVTLADAVQLDHLISHLEQLDHTAGGRSAARMMAFAQLDMALACLREASMSPAVRTRWMRVAARLARLCGFASADAGLQADAERSFATALSIAKEAGDSDSWLNIMCGMIRKSLQVGDLRRAADLLGAAEAGQRPRSAISACMLHAVRARVYGALGQEAKVLESIDRADELFTAGPSGADPAWLWYYDEAQRLGDTAHGLYPLALEGRLVEEATGRLRKAVALHRPTNARSIAFSTTKLATLTVRWRLPGAEAVVDRAIAAAGPVRSARLDEDLHDLAHALRRSGTDEGPRQLMTIRALLDSAR